MCDEYVYGSVQVGNLTVKVVHDPEPWNPRDGDNYTTLVCFHRRYNLGDQDHGYKEEDFNSWDALEEQLWKDGALVVLPLYMYDHSGLFISTKIEQHWWHAAWDSGQIGFAAVFPKQVRLIQGWKRVTKQRLAKLEEYARSEIEVYAKYIAGETYGYWVVDDDDDDEDLDSCYGFFGADEALQAGREAAYHLVATGQDQ